MKKRKIPVSVITGFLGSGKTTLVNKLLISPAMARTAVLVNEFGRISIDGDLIAKAGDSIIELKNGCVCCSLNEDLGTALQAFVQKRLSGEMPDFRRVLIETTGLANAGPITSVILEDPLVKAHYALDKVIATVDSIHGAVNLNIHAESVEQVAVADRIVLTKLDLVETHEQAETLRRLRERLAALNPSAFVLDQGDAARLFEGDPEREAVRTADPAIWIRHGDACSHGPPDGQGHATGEPRHDRHIRSFCIVRDAPIALRTLNRFWKTLSEEAGPNLLRVKGIVNVAELPDGPAIVQSVRQTFDDAALMPTWPSDDRRTRIVFIGWMIDEDRIRGLLETAENGSEAAARPASG